MTDHDMSTLLALATGTAEEAAALLRERRSVGVTVAATKSSLLDIVTEADRTAEELIRRRILAARPEDGFIGEEGTAVAGSSGVTWIVDPLDGTVNYLYEAGPYAVSIAAVSGPAAPDAWRALVGAVVVCTEQVTYAASEGNGATADGRPIGCSREDRLELALLATGFGYDRVARVGQAADVARVAPSVRDLRMGGSAAAELCLVASGRLDAYYERRLSPWDYAAGALIVREAGGVVEGPGGGTPDDELVLASAPALITPLRELLGDQEH
ncbi:inositol monophosphatase family protein [Leifsonia aquatica]|uniref:inositol monophosphatase family protein n=1 Tax=Leifsonia aquatica TaxID=144185 RepID=UPI00046B08C7|nr:inositol monophosphatase family protein [Leifsonia aquatica]